MNAKSRISLCLLSAVALLAVSCTPSRSKTPTEKTKKTTTKTTASDAATTTTTTVAKTNEPTKTLAIDPLDWPTWRGPEHNGISRETGLPDKINLRGGKGSNVIWASEELASRSTPIVMNGRLYLMCRADPETKREGEKVVCADAATGKILWENRFNVYLSDVPAERVGWASVTGDPTTGRVYATGVCGYFQCIDGETGKTIWSRSLHEEFGLLSTYGGRTNTPVIVDDLVIVSAVIIGWGDMAKPSHAFIAMNKATGEVVWFKGTRPLPYDTTYSTPTVTNIKGQKMMIFGSGDGAVWAFQPRTGRHIWKYQFSRRGLNISPLVVGEVVYMGHSEENTNDNTMGSFAAIKATGEGDVTMTGTLWRLKQRTVGKSSPVIVDGRVYAAEDGGSMLVLDAKTGKMIGKKVRLVGTIMRASPLYADGKLYVATTSGFQILKPTATGVKTLQKMRMKTGQAIHGSPIVSHGRIYLPTTGKLYCLGLKDAKPAADPRPEPAKESPVSENQTPAQVQIVPAEVLMRPGKKQQFTVRLFNALGQLLKESPAEFTLSGPGEISKTGEFTPASGGKHTATILTAKVGDLTGQARIRVIPPLPWKFDFEDVPLTKNPKSGAMEGEPPVAWVGVRYRHKIREIDGNKVLVKVDYIPKGTRSQGWMGIPDVKNYTIQADVFATIKNEKMPDIGLIAQGYTVDLMGQSQQLQIRTWTTQLRMAQTKKFEWKPGVWYTLKFRAESHADKAVLRAKVWKRGEDEPKEWTVEAVDPTPNLQGSPGLFGNATFAELYLDNITVTPNK
jgi:outer membrane protein assembly factor BamB